MANKNKSGKITIANIIAVLGITLLLVFSFVGQLYLTGGELGWSIIISAGVAAITALLLWFLIKAKGAENQLSKWRKIEIATLVVYVLVAIPASLYGGVMHFFVVNDQKNDMKEYAKEDLKKISQLIDDYNEFEGDAREKTKGDLINAVGYNQRRDSNLETFMSDREIRPNENSVIDYITNQEALLKDDSHYRSRMEKIENTVDSWSVMQVPFKARMIEDLAKQVEDELTASSKEFDLPRIENDGGVHMIVEENQTKEFEIDGGIDSLKFKKKLQDASGFSATALIIVLLLHFLILFNYIVAYRTSTLEISKKCDEDGGVILK